MLRLLDNAVYVAATLVGLAFIAGPVYALTYSLIEAPLVWAFMALLWVLLLGAPAAIWRRSIRWRLIYRWNERRGSNGSQVH